MSILNGILYALLPVSLAGAALCAAAEAALFSLTHGDRVRLRKLSPGAAAAVNQLLSRPRELLVTVLLANVTANTAVYIASAALAGQQGAGTLSLVIGALATLAVILFAEILPKTLAVTHRVRFSQYLARPVQLFAALIAPIRVVGDRLVLAPLARLVRPNSESASAPVTIEELNSLLETGTREGAIDAEEQRLLAEVVELGTLRVRDVMTPRVDIVVVDENATLEGLIDVIRRTGHSKFPIVQGTLDGGVVGFAGAKRLLSSRSRVGASRVGQIVEAVHYVPERARLDQLLEHFRRTKSHIAMCVSESGAVTGMVEIEDVIKELIDIPGGEDESVESQVRSAGSGSWEVSGRLGVRHWATYLGERSDRDLMFDPRIRTVGGLVLAKLGRPARVGDEVRIRNLSLRVLSVRNRTVDRVLVTLGEGGA